MLEIRKFSAGYGGKPVLNQLNLDLPAGQVTAILGPNGCGKSTLLKALAGILPATGSLRFDGRELLGLPSRTLAQTIAYLPQNRTVPEIQVERLVLHGRFPYLSYPRRYRPEDYAAAKAALERMGIAGLAHRELSSLSGGQRQKAYLAMALAQQTPILLLDEPNTFLDIRHQMQLMQTARQLSREGKTVVMVLHDLTLALELSDHFVVLEGGQVRSQGTAEAVLPQLEAVFQVEITPYETPSGRKYSYGRVDKISTK